MDATTMPSIHSLLPKLTAAFPDITFTSGERFSWSPEQKTVFYTTSDDNGVELMLHELSHGVLGHHEYKKDVELVAMEAAAWDTAALIGKDHDITIADDIVEDHLDTYREWLHARSTCPTCEATGYQNGKDTYSCVACSGTWRVNEARLCGLKRYTQK